MLTTETGHEDEINEDKIIESIKKVVEILSGYAPTSIILLYSIYLLIENGEELIGIFRRIETTDSDDKTIYKITDELVTYFLENYEMEFFTRKP
jgi:hypothetical protein